MKQLAFFLLIFPLIGFSQRNIAEKLVLDTQVNESSGLIFFDGKLITHNDSGNLARLYEIDTLSGNVSRTIEITNAVNTDWEDIAQDDTYIYIADIGNNNGNRTDLRIYRVLKADVIASNSITAETIDFSYEDQTDFTPSPNNNNWDAEALVSVNNQLVIFTKRWVDGQTTAYALPQTPGTYSALNMGTLNVQGLITGADHNVLAGSIYLTGYSNTLSPFIYSLKSFSANNVFSGINNKTTFSSTDFSGIAQIEGITSVSANRYLFSSERFSTTTPFPITANAKLFGFNTDDNVLSAIDGHYKLLKIFPNPVRDIIKMPFLGQEAGQLAIYATTGKKIMSGRLQEAIEISWLPSGIYLLVVETRAGIFKTKVIKE